MKKLIWLVSLLVIFSGGALILLLQSFDVNSIEGRGSRQKLNVKSAFKYGALVEGPEHYLLLQPYDFIRKEPVLSVNGGYWLSGDRYLEIRGLGTRSFTGDDCLNFSLNGKDLKCSFIKGDEVQVCPMSLLNDYERQGVLYTVADVVNNFSSLLEKYEKFSDEQGRTIPSDDIRYPDLKYESSYKQGMTDLECWVDRSKKKPSVPNNFHCDGSYFKCESSSGIKIFK